MRIKSSDHELTKGDLSIGFGTASEGKDLEDGTRVDLVSGDLIFITKDLNVVFDPVN